MNDLLLRALNEFASRNDLSKCPDDHWAIQALEQFAKPVIKLADNGYSFKYAGKHYRLKHAFDIGSIIDE